MSETALQQAAAEPTLPTVDDVRAAAARIAGAVVHTPTLLSKTLSAITGANVWLKFENLQFTAAYKERGALNKLMVMAERSGASAGPVNENRGVIAASAGNHAQGLAYHGGRLGIPVTIVMPRSTPIVKVQQTRNHGAEVVLEGATFEDAYAHARVLEKERGLTFVHPFDDPDIMAGQGTVALEMLADAPEIDTLVVPVGGGGLISGIAVAAKAIRPDIRVVGVQSNQFPAMYSLKTGKDIRGGGDTLAEGIAVLEPGRYTSRMLAGLLDDLVLVDEASIETALALLLQIEKTVVEGAGAAGLAAVMNNREIFAGKNVGIVLCGGNIDTRLLANVLLRDLARQGRLARLRIFLQDRPGSLYHAMHEFDAHNVNIIEISHQRIFSTLPAKGLVTDIECEARDREQLDTLIHALRAKGYTVSQVELD